MHLTLATDAGVFSPGRLDPGTRLLLEVAPPPPADGDLLDLGAGYGPLALVLAKRSPGARIWAVDVNERALELCAGNAAASGLANVRCVSAASAGPDSAGLPATYQLIWSNPPIRIGKQALHSMLTAWLTRLAPGAAAYLVVQRNLGSDSLQRWLTDTGFQASRYAARAGYRVLEVRR
jgi:16S rRNA (guanine1207-N2)-methyltransferase